ncbi:hypothetical protein PXD04_04545 [Methanosphaera sp. ISO3-F5]|uniref:hypothetical protein n=1 Tax=Methanosphaera sp. ISO3-F5 TaxID=1452353 RepID=UPI002B263246|nr:hypothetical protein [Methanosphaera sp. ISO3-F5]WQH65053.1 hypothetical protein PXD04_04545 [Methanosphaera sp. ISO3-F5]
MMKTIKVTQEVHSMLSEIGNKKDTYNDIILKLINEHNEQYSEEFEDDQADYYNKCIEKIENEDYSDIIEVDFDNIDEELERLESEGTI